MEPSLIPAVVVVALVLALAVAVLVALAIEHPDPAETTLAYEEAWDRLDFDLLWRLSGPELRDGRRREEFVAAKGATYRERADLAGLVHRVEVTGLEVAGRHARAVTTLHLRDRSEFRNEMRLRREGNRWSVTAYRLGSGPASRSEGRSGPASRSEGRSGPASRSEGRSGPASPVGG